MGISSRRRSQLNAVRNGTDLSLRKQKDWLDARLADLRAMLTMHEGELKAVDSEIGKRKAIGKWNPNGDRLRPVIE